MFCVLLSWLAHPNRLPIEVTEDDGDCDWDDEANSDVNEYVQDDVHDYVIFCLRFWRIFREPSGTLVVRFRVNHLIM